MLVQILVAIALVVLGAAAGYRFAQARERKAGGGKKASEIKAEMEEYQQGVSDHFMETAGLLKDMTEQYRRVYEHMAAGAVTLCESGEERPELEALKSGLLLAAGARSDETAAESAPEVSATDAAVEPEPGPDFDPVTEEKNEEKQIDIEAIDTQSEVEIGPDLDVDDRAEGPSIEVPTEVDSPNGSGDAGADEDTLTRLDNARTADADNPATDTAERNGMEGWADQLRASKNDPAN